MKNTQLFINFFNFAQKEAPLGLNPEYQVPVLIGTNKLTVILFPIEDDLLRFGLFLDHQKYARKTIIISANGVISEEEGVDHIDDMTDHEPDFSGITNEEIVLIVATEVEATLTQKKIFVTLAQYPGSRTLGLAGNASCMLARQYQFPFLRDLKLDEIAVGNLDVLDRGHVEKCWAQYGISDWTIGDKIDALEKEDLFIFICTLLDKDRRKWTGFRVLVTVGGNGQTYYCFQLFNKHPKSNTLVYSENNSPNVLSLKSSARVKTN